MNIDYHVEIDKHYYSVPYQLARAEVYTRTADSTVEVFYKSRTRGLARAQLRAATPTAPTPPTCPRPIGAMPSGPRRASWPGQKTTGPSTAALVAGILERRRHPEQGYRAALGIIRLGARHGTDRCEAACARALALGAYSYRSVQSILAHNLDRQPLPEARPVRRPSRTTATSAVARTTAERRSTMLTQPTTEGLLALNLVAMAEGLAEQRGHPDYEGLGFEERLALLVDKELDEPREPPHGPAPQSRPSSSSPPPSKTSTSAARGDSTAPRSSRWPTPITSITTNQW